MIIGRVRLFGVLPAGRFSAPLLSLGEKQLTIRLKFCLVATTSSAQKSAALLQRSYSRRDLSSSRSRLARFIGRLEAQRLRCAVSRPGLLLRPSDLLLLLLLRGNGLCWLLWLIFVVVVVLRFRVTRRLGKFVGEMFAAFNLCSPLASCAFGIEGQSRLALKNLDLSFIALVEFIANLRPFLVPVIAIGARTMQSRFCLLEVGPVGTVDVGDHVAFGIERIVRPDESHSVVTKLRLRSSVTALVVHIALLFIRVVTVLRRALESRLAQGAGRQGHNQWCK